MQNRKDLSQLLNLARRIRENPREDLDDALFYSIVRACWLEKEIRCREGIVEDHGKKYLRTYLSDGEGEWVSIRRILLDFTDRFVMFDGFLLDPDLHLSPVRRVRFMLFKGLFQRRLVIVQHLPAPAADVFHAEV